MNSYRQSPRFSKSPKMVLFAMSLFLCHPCHALATERPPSCENLLEQDTKILPLNLEIGKSEKWMWSQICQGQVVDMSKRLNSEGESCRKNEVRQLPNDNAIKPEFLVYLLLAPSLRQALSHRGLRIRCAKVGSELNLSGINFPFDLWLNRSLFNKELIARDYRTGSSLALEGSVFLEGMDAERMKIEGGLFMRSAKFDKSLDFRNVRVAGGLNLSNSTFTRFYAYGMRVTGTANFARNVTIEEKLTLTNAHIEGDLNMSKSEFRGDVVGRRLHVVGSMFLHGSEFNGSIDLEDSVVTSTVYLGHSVRTRDSRTGGQTSDGAGISGAEDCCSRRRKT